MQTRFFYFRAGAGERKQKYNSSQSPICFYSPQQKRENITDELTSQINTELACYLQTSKKRLVSADPSLCTVFQKYIYVHGPRGLVQHLQARRRCCLLGAGEHMGRCNTGHLVLPSTLVQLVGFAEHTLTEHDGGRGRMVIPSSDPPGPSPDPR